MYKNMNMNDEHRVRLRAKNTHSTLRGSNDGAQIFSGVNNSFNRFFFGKLFSPSSINQEVSHMDILHSIEQLIWSRKIQSQRKSNVDNWLHADFVSCYWLTPHFPHTHTQHTLLLHNRRASKTYVLSHHQMAIVNFMCYWMAWTATVLPD